MIISKNWDRVLSNTLNDKKFIEFLEYINNEYQNNIVYPPKDKLYSALQLVDYDKVKVVILGQDPYHQPGQAHGLSFSVENDLKMPPSLKNIFKELNSDLDVLTPNHSNLTDWANQGVLLLNTVLTVRQSCPNFYKNKGWEQLTNDIIVSLNNSTQPIVFLLWGNNAKKFEKLITNKNHLILTASHPSPLGANKGGWFGCKHFSKTNIFLIKNNIQPINWKINNIDIISSDDNYCQTSFFN